MSQWKKVPWYDTRYARHVIRDWWTAQKFAWQCYAALRRLPSCIVLREITDVGDFWAVGGYHRSTGAMVYGSAKNIYVAIRRMQREAEEQARAPMTYQPIDEFDL